LFIRHHLSKGLSALYYGDPILQSSSDPTTINEYPSSGFRHSHRHKLSNGVPGSHNGAALSTAIDGIYRLRSAADCGLSHHHYQHLPSKKVSGPQHTRQYCIIIYQLQRAHRLLSELSTISLSALPLGGSTRISEQFHYSNKDHS